MIGELINRGGNGMLKKFNIYYYFKSSKSRPRSIVRRFQWLLIGWGILVYLLVVTGFWFFSNHAIENTMQQQLVQWVAKVEELSVPILVANKAVVSNKNGVHLSESVADYARGFTEIAYIRILKDINTDPLINYIAGSTSNNFTHYSKQVDYPPIPQGPFASGMIIIDSHLVDVRLVKPVYSSNPSDFFPSEFGLVQSSSEPMLIGYIDMGLDFSRHKNELWLTMFYVSVLIFFFFFVAAVIGRVLTENALKPLLKLHEPLERLAKGDTDIEVCSRGDIEIVAISKALHSTINAIKGRDQELRRLADHDALTGLVNKRAFIDALDADRLRMREEKTASALIFIDLDKFKFVNDTLGHSAGDRLLVQIAQLLKSEIRSDDLVCRLAGDEFAVLAKSVNREGAVEVASGIVSCMQDFLFAEEGKTFNVLCSVGVALIDDSDFNIEDVFTQADVACYKAKSLGRNRFHVYDVIEDDIDNTDIGWSHLIVDALAEDNFVLYYQPIVNLKDRACIGYEVLLRMVNKQGDLLAPNMFIPIAERFGLATAVDYWVIQSSMNKLEAMNRGGERLCFYVNISGQVFNDSDFVERVLELLSHVDIDASQIVFELTERTAVGNIHDASLKMLALKEHGFGFAIDDFGSGFSSFSYLRKMPVDYVKIEGEFVERIASDAVDKAMVKSMIEIAKACGKHVIAEFVYDHSTQIILCELGVDCVQGFYIAEPASRPINPFL